MRGHALVIMVANSADIGDIKISGNQFRVKLEPGIFSFYACLN